MMVDAITAVSASAGTMPTQADRSLSITSEPDNKWVAARQSQIDADLVTLNQASAEFRADTARFSNLDDKEMEVSPDRQRHGPSHDAQEQADGGQNAEPQLSGESDAIGTVDFDDTTPFGHRTAIV